MAIETLAVLSRRRIPTSCTCGAGTVVRCLRYLWSQDEKASLFIESQLFFCCFLLSDIHLVFASPMPHGELIRFLAQCGQFTLTCRGSAGHIGLGPLCRGWILGRRVLSIRGGISVAARWPSGRDFGGHARHCVGSRSLFCRHHGCELEIPLYPPYRFFNRDYSVFDCGGMAFSEANLKPFIRVCSSLPGEPRTQFSGGSGPISVDTSVYALRYKRCAFVTHCENAWLGNQARLPLFGAFGLCNPIYQECLWRNPFSSFRRNQ